MAEARGIERYGSTESKLPALRPEVIETRVRNVMTDIVGKVVPIHVSNSLQTSFGMEPPKAYFEVGAAEVIPIGLAAQFGDKADYSVIAQTSPTDVESVGGNSAGGALTVAVSAAVMFLAKLVGGSSDFSFSDLILMSPILFAGIPLLFAGPVAENGASPADPTGHAKKLEASFAKLKGKEKLTADDPDARAAFEAMLALSKFQDGLTLINNASYGDVATQIDVQSLRTTRRLFEWIDANTNYKVVHTMFGHSRKLQKLELRSKTAALVWEPSKTSAGAGVSGATGPLSEIIQATNWLKSVGTGNQKPLEARLSNGGRIIRTEKGEWSFFINDSTEMGWILEEFRSAEQAPDSDSPIFKLEKGKATNIYFTRANAPAILVEMFGLERQLDGQTVAWLESLDFGWRLFGGNGIWGMQISGRTETSNSQKQASFLAEVLVDYVAMHVQKQLSINLGSEALAFLRARYDGVGFAGQRLLCTGFKSAETRQESLNGEFRALKEEGLIQTDLPDIGQIGEPPF